MRRVVPERQRHQRRRRVLRRDHDDLTHARDAERDVCLAAPSQVERVQGHLGRRLAHGLRREQPDRLSGLVQRRHVLAPHDSSPHVRAQLGAATIHTPRRTRGAARRVPGRDLAHVLLHELVEGLGHLAKSRAGRRVREARRRGRVPPGEFLRREPATRRIALELGLRLGLLDGEGGTHLEGLSVREAHRRMRWGLPIRLEHVGVHLVKARLLEELGAGRVEAVFAREELDYGAVGCGAHLWARGAVVSTCMQGRSSAAAVERTV